MDWTLRPFNAVFFGTAAVFLLLLIVSSLILRGRSEKTRKTVLVAACLVTFVGFFLYKYALSLDAEYDRLITDMDGFNWWGELPLHLCNVNMILIPIAVLTDCKPLKGFCFFVGRCARRWRSPCRRRASIGIRCFCRGCSGITARTSWSSSRRSRS